LPDTLPATTNDSYGYHWKLNPGSLGTSATLTTEPQLNDKITPRTINQTTELTVLTFIKSG